MLAIFKFAGAAADTTRPVIKGIEVQDFHPLFGETFYWVFYTGPYIVYQSQYQFDSSIHYPKPDSGLLAATDFLVLKSELRNRFFVFHLDSSYGFNYDPYRSNETGRCEVQSTLKMIQASYGLDSLLNKRPDTVKWNASGTELREVYYQKASRDTPAVKLCLYFSKGLNELKESFSPIFDSARKMKLYKIEIVVEKSFEQKKAKSWPAISFISEMREIMVDDPSQILFYIDKYKKYSNQILKE